MARGFCYAKCMGELLGITGNIGSGKTTFSLFLGELVQNHAVHETNVPIIEVANRFNQLLEAELNFETTDDDMELVNQALIWMPDVLTEHLHFDTTWSHLALTPKEQRAHPKLYEKLFVYLAAVRGNPKLVERSITSQNKSDYRPLLQWLGGYFVAKLSPTIWYNELFRRIDLHDSRCDLIIINGLRYPDDAAILRSRSGRVIAIERPDSLVNSSDITETERHAITPDIIVRNNGSLDQLQKTATHLWNDIASGKPQKTYESA